jgi:hypothetical protein
VLQRTFFFFGENICFCGMFLCLSFSIKFLPIGPTKFGADFNYLSIFFYFNLHYVKKASCF